MQNNSLLYQIAVNLITGIGPVHTKNLVSYCGSAEAVFDMPKSKLLKIPGFGKKTVDLIKTNDELLKRAEEEIAFIKKNKIQPLFYSDKQYPQRLKQCDDGPAMVYFKGNANLNAQRMIAIVGTRRISDYGKQICAKLVSDLAKYNVTIVSGLAYGVDFNAHKNAVDNNITNIGVLGHGLDMVYPAVHKKLSLKMIENGGILTEFLSGSNPDRENFPKRNRVIAGMCDAVIVVESAKKGGSIITAYIAHSYNRNIYAIPGKVGDKNSEGCNDLIKRNMAGLIENAEDLAYQLGWETDKPKKKSKQRVLMIDLDEKENIVYTILKEKNEGLSIDQISIQTELPLSQLAATMLSLEMKNIIQAMPGNRYQII